MSRQVRPWCIPAADQMLKELPAPDLRLPQLCTCSCCTVTAAV